MNTTSTIKSYELFAEIKKNLSAKTMDQYKCALTRSYRECGITDNGSLTALDDLSWIETHHIKIFEEFSSVKADLGLSTRRARASLFKEVCKQMNFVNGYLYFGHHHTILFNEFASEVVLQKRTKKQETLQIDANEYEYAMKSSFTIASDIIKQHTSSKQNYLLVQEAIILHLLFNPSRRDLGDCQIYRTPVKQPDCMPTTDKINFVYRTTDDKYFLVLRQFKNNKVYRQFQNDKPTGDHVTQLSSEIIPLVSWIMASPLNKTDSLLVNRKLLPMNRDIFGRTLFPGIMKKWTGKASRVGDWRSAKVTSLPTDATLQERQSLATKMCHTVSTQMSHYQKIDQNAEIVKEV